MRVPNAEVAELADALDLGSSVFRRAGSSPVFRTNFNYYKEKCFNILQSL